MHKGFTLIELLVVIAIIGVLSTIVMSSLVSARQNGANAAIKSGMASLRSQLELYGDANNNYGTLAANVCNGAGSVFVLDTKVASMVSQIQSASGVAANCRTGPNPPTTWIVVAQLKGGLGHWCIDSNGIAKLRAPGAGTITAPPSSTPAGCTVP